MDTFCSVCVVDLKFSVPLVDKNHQASEWLYEVTVNDMIILYVPLVVVALPPDSAVRNPYKISLW